MLGVLLAIFFVALLFVLVSIIKFKLHPFLALLLGGLLMGILAGMPFDKTAAAMAAGFGGTMQGIGIILAITGAGGAFGKIINETGIGKQLVEGMTGLTDGSGALILIAAFIISQVLRAAQGSTTVALVTTAAIFAPVVANMQGVSPLLASLAICAGGIGLSLPNDSGFWVINRFGRFDVPSTMRVWTVGGTLSGVTALIVVLILSMFTNSLPGLL